MAFEGLRAILTTAHPVPTAYPYGTMLQHRSDLNPPVDMSSLKGMVVGQSAIDHPHRIRIVRVQGHDIGRLDDVWVDLWEPVP